MNTHTQPERLRCEVCDMPTLGDTLCNYHYDEREKNMSTTHTPGPWAWIGDHTHKQFDVYELAQGIHARHDSKHICTINNLPAHKLANRDASRAEANARLIAASPDLLSALHAFRNAMKKKVVKDFLNSEEDAEVYEAYCLAGKAIAKAEGRGATR